ncbi:HAMP domain-containing histidine kinase [Mucilaginibacter robiniae]|uniref:histidine kinase n=1 Tax=Mucilaginibacter robiniae TaxID=2728022 RepID=A0A7L5DZF5_9SPHI|nr:HAMP domain-containing sensor histidine kinase [Mucilaginibacter robiniae]QJD96492.1 HAMP domain-containing histidine kinase [Mucilaginibacter robiniae]
MKKRSIGFIVGLMGFALLGVMAMQLYFLHQSYLMQSAMFDRDVSEALHTVVAKLSLQDANRFLNKKANAMNVVVNRQQVVITHQHIQNDVPPPVSNRKVPAKGQTQHNRQIAKLRDSLKRMIDRTRLNNELESLTQATTVSGRWQLEEYTDDFGVIHQRQSFTPLPALPKNQLIKPKLRKYDTAYFYYLDPQLGRQVLTKTYINPLWAQEQQHKLETRRLNQIKKMLAAETADSIANAKTGSNQVTIMALAEEYQKAGKPLIERINLMWIDSLLRFEMKNQGISLPFSYEVSTANNDSVIYSKAYDLKGERPVFDPKSSYQTPIFTHDVINDPGKIMVTFPDKNTLILNRMTYTMAISGGLLVVLVICFGYTIFSILKQKKISEMKTDFINNMTHEFKTPVSTIMIASEALKDPEVAQDKSRVGRLADIIFEENERLGSHIERVLNIARIEKDDFKLDKKPLDVNELISDVLDSMALKLQKNNAQVELHLDAINPVVEADELHFSNVLYNLIDNAIKYSREAPQITISTLNRNSQLVIRVADKGIGMSRDQQAKIFEQFYRVPTGNLHDVKGFGLGLSYVNTIVKRLNGMISVKSEKEKGSEFELKFGLAVA